MDKPCVLTMIEITCSQVVGSISRFGRAAALQLDDLEEFEEARQSCLDRIKELRKLLREAEKQVKILQMRARV